MSGVVDLSEGWGADVVSGAKAGTGRWSARGIVVVVDGMLLGVGGVFVTTASVAVTLIAAVAAVMLATAIVVARR